MNRCLSFTILIAMLAIVSPAFATNPELTSEGLEQRIDFWKKIYTQYGKDDIVIHDVLRVNLIYDVATDDDYPEKMLATQATLREITLKLGPKGYMRTIFPRVEGLGPTGGAVMAVAMAPIEVIGKLVKPFALAVRLFGNMTAGHFVILSLFGIVFLFGTLGVWSYAIAGVTVLLVVGIMLLELFVAFLQAYVFALLSAVFIGLMQHEH